MIASETLRNMSNEEHLKLGLKMHLQTDAQVSLPFLENGRFKRAGSGAANGKSLFAIDGELSTLVHPECDSYITVNQFETGTNREKKYVKYLCGYFVDLDLNHKDFDEGSAELVDKMAEMLDEGIDSGRIPAPFMVVRTGRGIALHYRFTESIDHSDEVAVKLYDRAYKEIFRFFEEFFASNPDFADAKLEVDKRVKDHARFCRLPGTKNTKVGRYARIIRYDEERDDFWTLMEKFGFSREHLEREEIPVKKKRDTISRKLDRACRVRRHDGDELIRPEENVKPWATKPLVDNAAFILRFLQAFFARRAWVEGDHRERFLFLIYNVVKLLQGNFAAIEQMISYNLMMQEPLPNYMLNNIIEFTDMQVEKEMTWKHGDGVYTFKPRTVLNEDWLDIPEEEARECGFFETRDRRLEREERTSLRMVRDILIAGLYLEEGMGCKRIYREISSKHPDLACKSVTTVKNVIKSLGLMRGMNVREVDFGRSSACMGGGQNLTIIANYIFFYFFSDYGWVSGLLFDGKLLMDYIPEKRRDAFRRYREECKRLYDQELAEAMNAPADEQEAALRVLRGNGNVLVLGSAGTGKSTLINSLWASLSDEEKAQTLFIAPTGKVASKLPNGCTIHSAFKLECGVQEDDCTQMVSPEIKRIVIDEIGMVRLDLFEYIVKMIWNTAEEFGTAPAQLIVVGDFAQTRAFVAREERQEYYELYGKKVQCYESAFWEQCQFRQVKLCRVRRQADGEFADDLRKVKYGDWEGVCHIYDRSSHVFSDDINVPYICSLNRIVNEINNKMMERFEDKKTIFAQDCDKKLAKKETIILAVGVRVMTTVNGKNYSNGSMGTIVKILKNHVDVLMDDTEEVVRIGRRVQYIGRNQDRSFKQFPLKPAFALTCEKAQGMTFDEINVVPGYFAAGQLYVVLSRCRSNQGIHIEEPFLPKELKVDMEALRMGSNPMEPEIEREEEIER